MIVMHEVYLNIPNTIPSYCQEDPIWCGAAVAQMILEGYPPSLPEHPYSQSHIWSRIQAHKDDPGVNWATDPDGLRLTLMELGGDPGVSWNIFPNPNAQSLAYSLAYWMTKRRFPAATLVWEFQHWVAITGITTDVDPTQQSTVNLQYIEIINPGKQPCPTASAGGIKTKMPGGNWYSNYWYAPGNYPASKWNGKYIAVIEPPLMEGMAKAPREVEKGKVISESTALRRALMWIKELRLDEGHPYTILKVIKPLGPLLVNREHKGYYIVPFGYEEGEFVQAAVLVNAYTGDFQEVGVFQRPMKYLSKDLAVRNALRYVCTCRAEAEARLIFQPSEQTQSRFLPVWKVTVKRTTLYVTHDGRVHEKLTRLPLGD